MIPGQRPVAVGEQVRRLLGPALLHEVNDPRLKRLTISEVVMSRDLKHATVYVISAETPDARRRAEIDAGFERSISFFRRLIGNRGGLRYVPKLRFVLDDTEDRAERIESLLGESTRTKTAS